MVSALFCLLGQGALSNIHYINITSQFIEFSKNVNNGTSYNGTTVFLDADIDFSGSLSEQFEPIGKYYSFQGTFDGQGHTISNLAMNSSSSLYVGLFGYSNGTTIRNVVLDSSCSVVSSYNGSNAFVGGIIGQCSDCTIENTVNMASVSFTGSINKNLFLGGIVGYISVTSDEATVKNCANYGSVTHSGTVSGSYSIIGGIVGIFDESSQNNVHIQNCLNYGTINHNGIAGSLYIGGILGYTSSGTCNIENCVSGGKITMTKFASVSNHIGSVVGYVYSSTTNITHCYWTSDVGNYSAYGYNQSAINIDTETSQVTLNTTTLDSLNSYNSSWDKWLLNTNNKTVTFKINSGKGFNISSQLILLPSLAESESHTFSGWFEDEECTKEFTESSIEVETTLYGRWRYVLTFDSTGGAATTSSKSIVYGQKYGELPSATKTGYTFTGWFTEKEEGKGEKITENDTVAKASDHTLYAHWTVNNYTLTFDFGNGTVVNETLKYNETITYPENLTREGFVFNGWNPKPERMPANDTTVVAQWIGNTTSEFIKIVFNKKGMTEEEVKEIIKRYTDVEFTIVQFEEDKNGETRIIIRFKDTEKAKDFVNTIRVSSGVDIVSISFFIEPHNSAASKVSLFIILGLMLL